MKSAREGYCRACGERIIWIKTTHGKNMPCNASAVVYWDTKKGSHTIVTQNGETIAKAELDRDIADKATGLGYIPHWATCPAADRFKKFSKGESKK